MKTSKEVIESLIDAVVASQKSFMDIPKNIIFNFFDKEGVSKLNWEKLYEQVKEKFEDKNKTPKVKEDRKHLSSVVDYTDTSHNDVKVRQPRKSVFSEIKKIAG